MADQVESTGQGATSEAPVAEAQESTPRVSEETTTALPSETPAAEAQEQPEPAKAELSVEEQVRRQVQSQLDKARNEARLQTRQEIAQQQQAEAERQRFEQMDAAELGEYVKKTTARQREEQQITRRAQTQMTVRVQQMLLNTISDTKKREEVAQANASQQYATFQDFVSACSEAEAEARAAKTVRKREKEIREALENERAAEKAESSAPVLGAGLPTKPLSEMTTEQKIAYGYRQAIGAVG